MLQGLVAPSGEVAAEIQRQAFAKGLMIETCGPMGEVVKVMPPLTIEAQDLAAGFGILDAIIGDALDRK